MENPECSVVVINKYSLGNFELETVGDNPESPNAETTFSAKLLLLNCTGETFTANLICSGQHVASLQAFRRM